MTRLWSLNLCKPASCSIVFVNANSLQFLYMTRYFSSDQVLTEAFVKARIYARQARMLPITPGNSPFKKHVLSSFAAIPTQNSQSRQTPHAVRTHQSNALNHKSVLPRRLLERCRLMTTLMLAPPHELNKIQPRSMLLCRGCRLETFD